MHYIALIFVNAPRGSNYIRYRGVAMSRVRYRSGRRCRDAGTVSRGVLLWRARRRTDAVVDVVGRRWQQRGDTTSRSCRQQHFRRVRFIDVFD